MGDKVVVFTKDGMPLQEVTAFVSRLYQLERTHRAEIATMAINADDYTREVIKYGNWVVVFGNGVVPDWVGFIVPPLRIKENTMLVSMYSAEYILESRRLPYEGHYGGTGTSVFTELLIQTKRRNKSIISSVDTVGGSNLQYLAEYQRQSVFEEVNNLADSVQSYWWIEPKGRAGDRAGNFSQLFLTAKFKRKRGVDYPNPIHESYNFANVEYSEVAPQGFANHLYMQGYSEAGDDPIEVSVQDPESISTYGIFETVVNINDATSVDGLYNRGAQELIKRSVPRVQVQGDVTIQPYPRIGDKAQFSLKARKFKPINLVIKKAGYSPTDEKVHIVADNVFWN